MVSSIDLGVADASVLIMFDAEHPVVADRKAPVLDLLVVVRRLSRKLLRPDDGVVLDVETREEATGAADAVVDAGDERVELVLDRRGEAVAHDVDPSRPGRSAAGTACRCPRRAVLGPRCERVDRRQLGRAHAVIAGRDRVRAREALHASSPDTPTRSAQR